MGAIENAAFNAKVQRIVGIYLWLDRLLSCLIAKKAMVCLRKHKPYNVLRCTPTEALRRAGARLLLLLVGHQGCEGGTWREWEREPPVGLGSEPQRGPRAEPQISGSGGGQNLAMAVLHYGGPLLWWADTHASADELVSLETAEHNIMHNFTVVQWCLSSVKNDHFYKMCVFVSISMYQGTFFHLSGFYR